MFSSNFTEWLQRVEIKEACNVNFKRIIIRNRKSFLFLAERLEYEKIEKRLFAKPDKTPVIRKSMGCEARK